MRRLFVAVMVLAALYAGYWVVGSSQLERAARLALDDLAARGWQVAYSDLSTAGFPSRFDTTVTDLALASPDGAFAWEAPFLQVLALGYRPNQVIAVAPPDQVLTLGGQRLDLSAQGLRASATVGLSADLPLDHAAVESGLTAVRSSAGWGLGLDRLLAAIRRAGSGAPNAYDLYLEANGLRPDAVGSDLGLLRLAATATFDRPLDRRLARPPRLLSLALTDARLAEGDVAVAAAGTLAPDARGFLAGDLTLRVENWRGLLDLLDAAGVLVHDQAPLLAGALEELAQGSPDLELPVTFRDGGISALGVVLLEAPQVL